MTQRIDFEVTDNNVITGFTVEPAGRGTTDYTELENKPSIEGVTLVGDVSLEDIGAADAEDVQAAQDTADAALTASGKAVRFDAAQTLTDAQKAQARGNVGAADAAEVSELKSQFGKYQDGCEDANVQRYYAIVSNKSEYDLQDIHCRIGVNFGKGVCRHKDCIVVKHDGDSIPFEFEPCTNENLIVGGDYGYQNDYSIQTGDIIILASVAANSEEEYTIDVYPTKQEHDFTEVISIVEGSTHSVLTVTGGISIEFLKSRYTMTKIDNSYAENYLGKITNSEVNMRERDNTLGATSLTISFFGDGYVFKKIKRVAQFNGYSFISTYTIYADSHVDIESYYVFNSADMSLKQVYSYFAFTGTKTDSTTARGCYLYEYSINNTKYLVSLVTNNVNTQRDYSEKPIYLDGFNTSAGDNGYSNRYGIRRNNVEGFLSGYIFYSKFSIKPTKTTLAQDAYELLNPQRSFASNNSSHKVVADAINLIDTCLLSCIPYLNEVGSSTVFRTRMDHYITYYLYKRDVKTLDEAYLAYSDFLLNVLYTDISNVTESSLLDAYSVVGIPYMGRTITLAYFLMKDYENVDSTKANNLKQVIIKYADMLCTHWEDTGVIGTKADTTSSTANTLTSALYGISMAIELSDDTTRYVADYDEIVTECKTKAATNTIFVESDDLLHRYLHYASFSTAMYALSLKHYDSPTKILSSNYLYILDSTKPSGQICDITECSSDSRRGCPHTYVYNAITLLLSGNDTVTMLGYNVIKWFVSLLPVYGDFPDMLDGYTTYSAGDINLNNLEFAIVGLIELRNTIFNYLIN